jgi:hypothetical protein
LYGLFLFVGVLVNGCGGQGNRPDVAAGQFTANVNGTVSDTLAGAAHYRMDDGALVGLELGSKEGPGLSIELEPQPPELRTYEVVDAELFGLERPGSPPGVLAFLLLEQVSFEATDGSLDLTYVSEEQIGATFSFEMEATNGDAPTHDASVEVTGALNAPPQ